MPSWQKLHAIYLRFTAVFNLYFDKHNIEIDVKVWIKPYCGSEVCFDVPWNFYCDCSKSHVSS